MTYVILGLILLGQAISVYWIFTFNQQNKALKAMVEKLTGVKISNEVTRQIAALVTHGKLDKYLKESDDSASVRRNIT